MTISKINPIELEIFKNRFRSICEEMGAVLCRSSFSPNIKERQDFSCALFDPEGQQVAQAAHIPVHLGSMPLSVQAALKTFQLKRGDMVILNDPYFGGTHLPDITLVQPIFLGREKKPSFFAANRAHHSDVGGQSPGSMPLATHLEDEGVVIPPTMFQRRGRINKKWLQDFLSKVRNPQDRRADLLAQLSANRVGVRRLAELAKQSGRKKVLEAMKAYQRYEETLTRQALRKIPAGRYRYHDFLDDDGIGPRPVKIAAEIRVRDGRVTVDLSQSGPQVRGPLNATRAVTLSAVAFVFRCLVLMLTGESCLSLRPIQLRTRKGTVVDSKYPAPVAGGNVETSQRIVDVLLGALSRALPQWIPAAGQGTMNNVAMGGPAFTYYETIAGGMGAGPSAPGEDAIHTHMTNTLNTPIEALESELPLQITAYRIRKNSGGGGLYRGGRGLIREYRFLTQTQISLLTERRRFAPYGLQGGAPGKKGRNFLIRRGRKILLPGKTELQAEPNDRLVIETPGGGGFGRSK